MDPCVGTCGIRARCEVINHNPICSCPDQYTGDPFTRCLLIGTTLNCELESHIKLTCILFFVEKLPAPPLNPCLPSPCGPNSICKTVNDAPVCTCLPEFIGSPPNCKPECISNSECADNLACINQKCRDPCPGSCGVNALCRVVSHTPNCACNPGYTGDAFVQCIPIETLQPVSYINPCVPSPCGPNAICREQDNAGSCTCLPNYIGNPYEGCRPECILSTDCQSDRACIRNKCQNPCPGTCAANAECQVVNHLPSCTCVPGYTGDPFVLCRIITEVIRKLYFPLHFITNILFVNDTLAVAPENPCLPSPCGPNSQCRNKNGQAVCSCLPNYIGSPPGCRPECVVSSECPLDKACISQKCSDPCPGTCGIDARCQVVNHSPICSCLNGLSGDPFVRCLKQPCKVQYSTHLLNLFILNLFSNSTTTTTTS